MLKADALAMRWPKVIISGGHRQAHVSLDRAFLSVHGFLYGWFLVAKRGLWRGARRRPRLEHPAAHLCVGALGFDLVPSALVACLRRRRGD